MYIIIIHVHHHHHHHSCTLFTSPQHPPCLPSPPPPHTNKNTQELFAAQPAAYVAFLSLLTSLAHGEQGAFVVYKLLSSAPQGALFSWRTTLNVMLQYCSRFRPNNNTGAGSQADRSVGGRDDPQSRTTTTSATPSTMPESDAQALTAFLQLLARVVGQGAREHVRMWLREVEEAVGVSPLWELFFQLLCHPVPSVCVECVYVL